MSRDELYLRHVLEAIEIIRGYAEAGEESYLADRMRQDAIVRRLEIVWRVVEDELPSLEKAVRRLLQKH